MLGGLPMLMLALGDSITYGYGATTPEHSFAKLLQKQFAKNVRATLHVQAKPGWTSRQLNRSLRELPACIFDEAEIVTLMIGGNDLLKAAPFLLTGSADRIAQVCERSREEIEEIVECANRSYNTFALATLYNPFPNFGLAEQITNQYNDMLRAVAARNGLVLVESQKSFRGREHDYVENYRNGLFRDIRLFRNPIHPTDAGHHALYQAFYRALQRARARERAKAQRRRLNRQTRRA